MPNSELHLSHINQIVALLLVIALLLGSLYAWGELFRSRQSEQPWLDWCDEPRANWTSFAEVTVLGLVFLMFALMLTPKLDPLPPPSSEPLTVPRLIVQLVFTGGLALVFPAILICSQRPPSEFGFKLQSFPAQVRDGVIGFLLALLPMVPLMLLTAPFRNHDSQNPLLTLLADEPEPATVALICITAVVFAPLFEEMMFRVVLQGWLTTIVRPGTAIPVTAVAFAAIHGVVDGVALLPLAGVLGYVFHRRHSYISVVVIHGLFNATMLALALLTQTGQHRPPTPRPSPEPVEVANSRLLKACESFKFNGGPAQDVALALADAARHRAWVETHATKFHKL